MLARLANAPRSRLPAACALCPISVPRLSPSKTPSSSSSWSAANRPRQRTFATSSPRHFAPSAPAGYAEDNLIARDLTAKFDQHIFGQDPHGRIFILNPGRFRFRRTASSKGRAIRGAFGIFTWLNDWKVLSWTPELVPFYTMNMLMELRWEPQAAATGKPFNRLLTRNCYVSQGCTVAAVGPDHWAHGVVLNEDVLSAQWDERSVLSSTTYLFNQRVGDPDLPGDFDISSAPLFAYPPPRPNRLDQQHIAEYRDGIVSNTEVREQWSLDRELDIVHSFPHYRLVYKLECDKGTAFLDASTNQPPMRLRPANDEPARQHEGDYDPRDTFRYYREGWILQKGSPLDGDGKLTYSFLTPQHSHAYASTIVRALRRGRLEPDTWQDPYMYPIFGTQGKDSETVITYITDSLFSRSPGEGLNAPSFLEIKKEASSVSAHLRAPRPKPKPPNSGAGSATNAKAGPSSSSDAASDDTRSSLRDNLRSRLRASMSQREARNEFLRDRAREQVQHQKSLRNTQRAQAAQAAEVAAAAGRDMARNSAVLLDPMGYYKRLGISPEHKLLLYAQEDTGNESVRDAYMGLVMRFHPDRAQTPAEEKKMNKKMAEINLAYDHLETCELRVKYHNSHTNA